MMVDLWIPWVGIGRRGGKGRGNVVSYMMVLVRSQRTTRKLQGSRVMAMEWVSLESQNTINIPPPSLKDAPVLWLEQLQPANGVSSFLFRKPPRVERVHCLLLKYTSGIFV